MQHSSSQKDVWVLYHKEFAWTLFSLPGRETLNPWNLPRWTVSLLFMVGPLNHTWIYANEATHGGPLNSLRRGRVGWGVAMLERPALWLEGWGFEPLDISLTSGEGRGVGGWVKLCGQWHNWSCLYNEILIKFLATQSWYTWKYQECVHDEDTEGLCLGPSQTWSSGSLLWPVLICVFLL